MDRRRQRSRRGSSVTLDPSAAGGSSPGGFGERLGRLRSRKKNSFNTPRRREVQLSKISIYIVFMFVICHR